jgi:hypothetical protein
MPRRKNVDGDAATTNVKQPRVRKKKEPSSICSTPTAEHGMMKLEQPMHQSVMGSGFPPGCGPGGPMDGHPSMAPHGMMPGGMHHLQHQGLPNGISGGPQQLDEGPNGMGGPGFCGQQGPPFDFYQQGPPQGGGPPGMPPPHFVPPPMPMYGDGPPSGPPQMMMQQPQSVQGPPVSSIGPLPPGSSGQQFHSQPGQDQSPQLQMMPPMHSHPGAPNQPGSISTPQGPPPQQMPPQPHQLPLPHPMFPGGFPRQPGPIMLFPPPSIPQPPFLEFRLQEMNRRLYQFHSQFYQQAPCESHEQWWDAFSQEFFDELGSMSLCMQEYSAEQGGFVLKRYSISRHFIPRFFRSLFTNGISQLHFVLRSPAQEMVEQHRIPEMFGCCALNCENLLMVTSHERPLQTEVQTECRLFIKFAPFNPTSGYRIREWFIELRSCQEFYAKDGIHPMDGMGDRKLMPITSLGLPLQTMAEMRMWQMMDQMQPIVDRVKETNETPQVALQQLVAERLEIERQRMAASIAASGAHSTQTPPHNQNNVFASPGGQTPNQMMGNIIGGGGCNAGMGPPQMPPPSMGAMQPPLQSTTSNASVEEPKPKPKRQRRKTAAANAIIASTSSGCAITPSSSSSLAANNNSPPKNKKGSGGGPSSNLGSGGTPPTGMPPMGPGGGFPLGMPPGQQFHPLGGVPPPGQYHHDVLTVGEPLMMGCEFGESDERRISRVENTAFSSMNLPPSTSGTGGGMMLPPPGMSTAGGLSLNTMSGGQGQQILSGHQQQQILENSSHQLLSDFDIHSQQQQQQINSNSGGIWAPPSQTSSSNTIDTLTTSNNNNNGGNGSNGGNDQWELKCAKV